MKCIFTTGRIERCLVCLVKCQDFLSWYHSNKDKYNNMVEDYVTKYPEKYKKEYQIMPTKKVSASTPLPHGKLIAIVNKDGHIEKVVPKDEMIKSVKDMHDPSMRYIELTGKEYEVVVSIAFKQISLDKI